MAEILIRALHKKPRKGITHGGLTSRCMNWSGVFLILVALLTCSCAGGVDAKRNRMRELRSERTDLVDDLYREYGGSRFLGGKTQVTDRTSGSPLSRAHDVLLGAAQEADRLVFETYVQAVGEGNRAPAFSTEAREFFSRQDVKNKARRFVRIGDEIRRLEKDLERAGE